MPRSRRWSSAGPVRLRQQNRQGAALDQLHGEVRPVVGEGAQLVDRDHARVLQLSGDLRLLDEPADQVGLLTMLIEQDLDGQVAAEVAVAPLDDDAHAAAGDLAEQLEPGQAVGWVGHLDRRGADHRLGAGERLSVAQVQPRDVRNGFGQPRQRRRRGCCRQRRRRRPLPSRVGHIVPVRVPLLRSAAGWADPQQAGRAQPSGCIGGPLLAAVSAVIPILHRQTSTPCSRVVRGASTSL